VLLKQLREDLEPEKEVDMVSVSESSRVCTIADIPQQVQQQDDDIDDLSNLNDDDYTIELKEKKSKRKVSTRVRWSEEELKELQEHFGACLERKTCPSKKMVIKAINVSKAKGGKLGKRYWHTVVKNISNLNNK
jgi:hypothetical protein